MTSFLIGAAALLAVALLMLRPTARARPAASRVATNLGLLKTELLQLDAELAAGRLDAARHLAARDELQRRVLHDTPLIVTTVQPGRPGLTWAMLSLGVAALTVTLYGFLGNLAALDAPRADESRQADAAAPTDPAASADPMREMVERLAQRLESEPRLAQDVSAWTMLARAYAAMQRFPESSQAYARALALTPDDAQLLADRADVLAVLQGRRAAGEPERLVERALQIDPGNLKALAIAGSAAFERNDKAAAIAYWQRARQRAPTGSEFATGLDRSLAEAGATPGPPAAAPATTPTAPSAATGTNPAPLAAGTASIDGRVSLSPALASRIAPGDTVFITARAVDGPRMPLAVLRRTAAELPFSFHLDETMAMSPELTLAKYPQVIVTARISRSGTAMPQAGDLQTQAPTRAGSGTPLALVIDTPVP